MKRLFFFILFLALLVSFGNEGWVKWYRLKHFENSLEEHNRQTRQKNLALRKEIENLKDSKYLEFFIRENLGYIKDHEILYEDLNLQAR